MFSDFQESNEQKKCPFFRRPFYAVCNFNYFFGLLEIKNANSRHWKPAPTQR